MQLSPTEHSLQSLLGLGVFAWTLTALPAMADTNTVFPSDGHFEGAVAELLKDVCPGKIAGDSCPDYCPEGAPLVSGLTVNAVYRGHFLSPTSEDALLSEGGCESHQEQYGGAVLLTRRTQQWKMLWYRPGVITKRCHKVALRDRREILVCIDEEFAGWIRYISLYTEDLLDPNAAVDMGLRGAFFVLRDTKRCCNGGDPDVGDEVSWGDLEMVEFGKNIGAGPPPIIVTATFGKGKWTAEALSTREKGYSEFEALLPPLKQYRIEFIFDGKDYNPAPNSAATAKIFERQ